MPENVPPAPNPEPVDWEQFTLQARAAPDSYVDDLHDTAAEEAAYLQAQEVFIGATGEHAEALGLPVNIERLPNSADELGTYSEEEVDSLLRADTVVNWLTQLPGNANAHGAVLAMIGDTLFGLEDRDAVDTWLGVMRRSCARYGVDLDAVLGDDPEVAILQVVSDKQRIEEDLESQRIPKPLRDARYEIGQQAAAGLLEELSISPDHDEANDLVKAVTSLCATDLSQPLADNKVSLYLDEVNRILGNTLGIPSIDGVIQYINDIRTTILDMPPISVEPDEHK